MKEATIKININTKNAVNSIDELNNEFNGTLQTIGDLRIASQKLSEELESTPVGTDKFKQLQSALIDVNGQLKDYELSIEALDNEQFASEIRSVVGGVMDLVGGLTLLGVSDDNIEKIAQKFAKLEGISRAATGAMDIYNSGAKVMNSILTKSAAAQEVMAAATTSSSVANVANAGSTTAVGVASTGAAVKVRALTAAMLSNPFTAIAVAITAVISALILFGDESEEAEKKHNKFAESVVKNSEDINKRIDASLKQMDLNIKQMELEGATQTELFNAKVKLLTDEENLTFKHYNANLLRISNLSKRKDEASKEQLKLLKDENKALDDKLTKDQYGMNSFDYSRKELEIEWKKWKKDNDKDISDNEKEDYIKRTVEYRKYLETLKLLNLKYDDEILDLRIKLSEFGEEENVKRFNSIEVARDRELKLNDRALDAEIKNLKEALDNKIITQEQYDKDINGLVEKNAKKEELIIVNSMAAKKELEEKIQDEINQIRADAWESNRILEEKRKELNKKGDLFDLEMTKFSIKKKVEIINSYYTGKEERALKNYEFDKEQLIKTEEIEKVIFRQRRERVDRDLKNGIISQEEAALIKQKITSEEIAFSEKHNEKLLTLWTKYQDDVIDINKNAQAEINQLVIDNFDKFGDWLNAISGPLTQFTDIMSSAFENMNENMQRSIDTAYTSGTEMQNKLYAEQLISREEYDNKIALLDQQKANKEKILARKAFNQQKALNIVNATMQGAQAVLSAFAAGSSLSPLGPVTTGPIFAGIAGALAATQIGIISAQKFKANRGGLVPGEASKTDSVNSLLAPGEMVINSTSSDMFAPLLSAINQAGGGIPLAPQPLLSQNSSNNVYVENGNNIVKAYVVESELSQTQRRVDRLKNNASF